MVSQDKDLVNRVVTTTSTQAPIVSTEVRWVEALTTVQVTPRTIIHRREETTMVVMVVTVVDMVDIGMLLPKHLRTKSTLFCRRLSHFSSVPSSLLELAEFDRRTTSFLLSITLHWNVQVFCCAFRCVNTCSLRYFHHILRRTLFCSLYTRFVCAQMFLLSSVFLNS